MSKDKSITKTQTDAVSPATSASVTEGGLDLNDETDVERFLDIIAPDLQVAARDVDEPLRGYAERMLSALQDARFELVANLDDLERDFQEIIEHLDAHNSEAPR